MNFTDLILRDSEWISTAIQLVCVLVSIWTLSGWRRTYRDVCGGNCHEDTSLPACIWVCRKLLTERCILIAQALTFATSVYRTIDPQFVAIRYDWSFVVNGFVRTLTAAMLAWCVWINRRSYERLGNGDRGIT